MTRTNLAGNEGVTSMADAQPIPPITLDDRVSGLLADPTTQTGAFLSRLPSLTLPWHDVTKYGAIGDGEADDTDAIRAAIAALPAEGGTVYLPAGTYRTTGTINLRSALRISGDGPSASVIAQSSTTADGLAGTDILFLELSELRISGPSTGSGVGIRLTRTSHANTNNVVLTNLYVRTFGGDGIYVSNGIVGSLTNVQAESNGGWGFHFEGENGIAGTSVGFHSCYANVNALGGFLLDTMAYTALHSCASEGQPIDYAIRDCLGLGLFGCGSEKNKGVSFLIEGGYGTTIVGGWVYENSGIGIHVVNGSVGNSIISVSETSPTATATAFLQTEEGVTVAATMLHNSAPFSFASGTVTQLADASGAMYLAGNLAVPGEVRIGTDTNLYRVSPNVLATDDGFSAGGDLFAWGGFGVNGRTPVGAAPAPIGTDAAAVRQIIDALKAVGIFEEA